MDKLINKYDCNILHEVIHTWDKNKLNMDNLNEICFNESEIILNFNIGIKNIYFKKTYLNKKGYFTEKDIFEIIFTYYNGNISENEYTKLINYIDNTIETKKDLLIATGNIFFDGFDYRNDMFYTKVGK